MAQRTIAAFFQSRPPAREALGDATNVTSRPVAASADFDHHHDARATSSPPRKRARVAAPLPFAKGADVMDVRGASSRAFGAQFCDVDGREILLCGNAWGAEDLTRPKAVRWLEPDAPPRARRDDDVSHGADRPEPSNDDDAVGDVGDVAIRGTNGLVARADGAVIRVYDASDAGAAPLASLCLAHDDVSSDASECECTRRTTRLDAAAVSRMTSCSAETAVSDVDASDVDADLRANLAATTAGGELVAFAVRRERTEEKTERVVATLLGRALLTEGTFQHAFPDTDGSESRLGPFCMVSSVRSDRNEGNAIARFAVAAAATGALCFVALTRDASAANARAGARSRRAAVARLDRVVSPHLPSFSRSASPGGRPRSVIHDVALWTRPIRAEEEGENDEPRAKGTRPRDGDPRRPISASRAAAVSVGGDGVLAVTHFDPEDGALDTAWRCVPEPETRTADVPRTFARVVVCDAARTAVTLSAEARERDATATVWTLEGETEIRRVPFGTGLGHVSGLAIDTRGRLIAASFDDARSGRGARVRVARGR